MSVYGKFMKNINILNVHFPKSVESLTKIMEEKTFSPNEVKKYI
jgi:hypothetical protein